ncbi:metallophosphoesterase [Microbacterium invictum]|uniref:MPP superfamily phosphohydrolase n=1 Tax=Microbacterium invictum TaxID=515415 RepID=A0AA40SLH9_9MICO|nr:putative MPP superfamily phosphohydrolase [Microbacterium invictum]
MTGTSHRVAAPVSPWLVGAAAVGAAGAAAAAWGIGIERHLYTVRRHEMAVLPAGAPPVTVLHLSDAHMAPWQKHKQRWIAALAADVKPDLVINTGDNLGHADGLTGIRTAFAPLRDVPGLFVHGSNDVIGPIARNPLRYLAGPSAREHQVEELDTAAMDAFFTDELGWRGLNNAAASLEIAGLRIDAFGVSDAHRDWDELDALPAAIAGLPRGEAAVTLGVTHAPYRRVLDGFIDLGASAIFAGHTHGGQVRIPFSPSALVANCDIPLDQARGLSTWTTAGRTVPLNVSAGLGHSIYAPVRFGCRPEASVLTLTAVA